MMQADTVIRDSSQAAPVGAFFVSSLVLLWLVYTGAMTTEYFTAYLIAWVTHGGLSGLKSGQLVSPPTQNRPADKPGAL